LKSGGDMSKYWEVLTANGIDSKRLATYERKITFEPWYKPEAIGDFERYLVVLKQMHSSTDLQTVSDSVRGHVGGDVHGMINDVLGNYNDSDVIR
jgi:alpha-glucan,water dikinase